MTYIKIKRAYETPSPYDGFRILVDRLWPRGLTHDRLDCQLWAKEIAPSTELREWFHASPVERWTEFEEKYKRELSDSAAFKQFLDTVRQHSVVTFIYASKDIVHNEATILKSFCDSLIESTSN